MPKQLNITPYVFPVVTCFLHLVSNLNGPNRSIAVQVQAGDDFSLSNGSFPMICSLSLLSSFLHITQLYLIVLTIFNSLTIQNLVRILLAVERTPRCPLLWICSLHRRENRVIIRKKHEFIFVVTHLNPPFSPSSNHVYPICILSGAQTFVSSFLSVFIHAFLCLHNPEFFCLRYITWS